MLAVCSLSVDVRSSMLRSHVWLLYSVAYPGKFSVRGTDKDVTSEYAKNDLVKMAGGVCTFSDQIMGHCKLPYWSTEWSRLKMVLTSEKSYETSL